MVRLIFCISFLLLFSCGQKNFPDYSGDVPPVQYQLDNGLYKISFSPLNRSRIRAEGLSWIKGNQFYIKIIASNLKSRSRYQQYIHKGSKCPTREDDENKDGIIDREEVLSASGKMLIPLDANLNSRGQGIGWFPRSNKEGKYYYSRSSVLNSMLIDLYSDIGHEYGMAKLESEEELYLLKRVIIIYDGSENNPLYPLACGIIKNTETSGPY